MSGDSILERVYNLSGREFERFVASLWELQGWKTEITEMSGDGGKDIIAKRNLPFEVTIKIEAKGWNPSEKISGPQIRQYALLPGDDADHAVVVTSSSFTEPAKRAARRHGVKLVNGTALARLVQKLDANALLTTEFDVGDWKQITSAKHPNWMVATVGDGEPVTTVPGIGERRAEQLAEGDVNTLGDLLTADPERLAAQTTFAESRLHRWANLAAFYKEGERADVLDGIGQAEVEQLSDPDIYTVDDLRNACPKEVATKTALREHTLKKWVGDAVSRDVTEITALPKVGTKRAKEFAKVGIFTVSDLAETNPEEITNQVDLGVAFLETLIQEARNYEH